METPRAVPDGGGDLSTIPATFAEAYRDYAQAVARWAWQLGGPEIEVEDAVQEVFLVVSRRLSGFRGDSLFSTWLFAITRKVIANHRRRHRWRFWSQGDRNSEVASLPAPAVDPQIQLEQAQARAFFHRVLGALPERYRVVLVLFELEDLSTRRIAELCDCTIATVKVRLHRARKMFVRRYERLREEQAP